MPPTHVAYRRIQHAAHYSYGPIATRATRGHDLEQWDVTGAPMHLSHGAEVPHDAKYHSGYIHEGKQHWIFTRVAPLTGTCPHCEGAKS